MDGEDLGAGFGFDDGGVPMKAGKLSPDFGVFLFVFAEEREQRRAAFSSKREWCCQRIADAVALCVVEHDWHQIGEVGIEQGKLVALAAREEDHAGGLIFDKPADERALFLGELIVADADIAEENHIVGCEVFGC